MTDYRTASLILVWLSYISRSSSAACTENEICDMSNALICRNNTCVSACTTRGMSECVCDTEDDNNCYLCCGNSHSRCLPAHQHNILKSNGERWESDACRLCRQHGDTIEGHPCDDNDPQRLCIQGKCSNSICHDKQQGDYCYKDAKICVDNVCQNPCAQFGKHLMVCDCEQIDQDTGFASEDRCQLCCYDPYLTPFKRRCQNAYRTRGLVSKDNRPIWRVGLSCAGGKTCNRFGVCRCASIGPPVLLIAVLSLLTALLRNG